MKSYLLLLLFVLSLCGCRDEVLIIKHPVWKHVCNHHDTHCLSAHVLESSSTADPNPPKSPAKPKLTKVQWEVLGNYPYEEPIEVPEVLWLNQEKISFGQEIAPNKYQLTISHPGYSSVNKEITIPKTQVFTIKETLKALARSVVADIGYEVEPVLPMNPTTIELTSINTGATTIIGDDSQVIPGTYMLKISKEAYHTVSEKIRIFPASSPYVIRKKLKPRAVPVQVHIDFDIQPHEQLPEHIITFVAKDTGIRQEVRPGGKIVPGNYEYIIEKPGYKMANGPKSIKIYPGKAVLNIHGRLEASERKISFCAINDGVLYQPQTILINSKNSHFGRYYKPGQTYRLLAKFQNHRTIKKDISITPGPGVYVLKLPLIAK